MLTITLLWIIAIIPCFFLKKLLSDLPMLIFEYHRLKVRGFHFHDYNHISEELVRQGGDALSEDKGKEYCKIQLGQSAENVFYCIIQAVFYVAVQTLAFLQISLAHV
mgnify:CR=1 FL=1